MKIKTVWSSIDDPFGFDNEVNTLMEQGWQLTKREVLDGKALCSDAYQKRLLYAELVLPEEPEELEPQEDQLSPLGALHVIQDACFGTNDKDCLYKCPLRPWCNQLRDGGDPTDWDLTQLEADA